MTPQIITERLEEAADTFKRLPSIQGPLGYKSSMPTPVRQYWESFGNDGDPMKLYTKESDKRLGPPETAAIDRLDEVEEWLSWLDQKQFKLLWSRANKFTWPELEGRFKRNRRTLQRWHQDAVRYIMLRLTLNKNAKCA